MLRHLFQTARNDRVGVGIGRKCKRRKPCGFRLLHAVKRLFFGGSLATRLYLWGRSEWVERSFGAVRCYASRYSIPS